MYFPSEYSDLDQRKFEEDMSDLFGVLKKQEIHRGSAGGWILEDIPIPKTTVKGKAFQAFIGWDSIDSFKNFQQTVAFAEILRSLKSAKDLKGITLVFYTGKQVDKDS